jgi:hypothetical protein
LRYTPEFDGGELRGVVLGSSSVCRRCSCPAEERMARGEIVFLGLIDNWAHFCPRPVAGQEPTRDAAVAGAGG